MKNAIYVIDPGMMEAGGHHAALIETLVESDLSNVRLSLIAHKNLDCSLAKKAEMAGILIQRHFECNFYQHYEDGLRLKLSGIQSYIRHLAVEYTRILSSIIDTVKNEKVVCFYPCLNWEHALALNLALSNIGDDGCSLTHKVCCMFKPPESCSSNDIHYRIGFQRLGKLEGVELYASDWETREYFLRLEVNIIDIHPCYLMPWMTIDKVRKAVGQRPHILLYMGDAKVNKGFNQLPALVIDYLTEFSGNVRLTIQYTLAWDYPELVESINELDQLSGKYEQLTVDKSFWPMKKVVNTFNSIDAAVCGYDIDTYMNKSSGLAWLAAFFGVPVAISGSCWIERELFRLNSPCQSRQFSTEIKQYEKVGKHNLNEYFSSIFSDFLSWLLK
tara:strand:- start:25578 stop:26741 length:1164 start_codon:yes stop_codon:yes gene_type:complete